MIEKPASVTGNAARLTARKTNGLRVTPEYLAWKAAMRKSPLGGDISEVDVGLLEETIPMEEGESIYFDIKSQQLYQVNPRKECTYTKHKNRSFTDSIESYQNGAKKEWTILRWNNRTPTIEVRINLKKVYLPERIKEFKKKIHRTLQRRGFQGVANIELTTRFGKPNNRVHFHFLTDDPRSKEELKELIITACERCGLEWKKDFVVKVRKLWNGKKYFAYFTKYGEKYEDKVKLFKKITGLQKFSQIGKWFKKGKGQIWKEVQAFMKAKDEAKKLKRQEANKQRRRKNSDENSVSDDF